jgi:hypothetical protein
MHVAHVSGGKVANTPTTADDVDLLALVLGGTAAADGAPFPATLEAAIAGGAPHDADDGATGGDGAPTPGDSDPALTLAAALAASLAVEKPSPVAVDPVATDASVGAAVVDGPARDAAAIGVAIDASADATTAIGVAIDASADATTAATAKTESAAAPTGVA